MWVEMHGEWYPCRIVERWKDTITVNVHGTLYEVPCWRVSTSRPLYQRA